MAPGAPSATTVKPTFAKIAAKAVAPTNANQNSTQPGKNSNDTNQSKTGTNVPSNTHTHPKNGMQNGPPNGTESDKTPVVVVKTPAQIASSAQRNPQVQIIAKEAGDSTPAEAVAKTPTDDASTQVSSSESSVKMPNFDKQSVASTTTFAMDEKESLRPDDSASIRAIEEEDGPSTGAAGSRVGSDTEARAFSDQLHRIQQIGNMPPRAILQPGQRPNITFGSLPLNPTNETQPSPANESPKPVELPPGIPHIDEKLLDGLSSPRDRVFILKVEQDILDFMKNEKDMHMTLPDSNSFYRMLAHRLADYYGLEHTHHPRDSGTAVLISKTPHSRIPPPLSGLPVPGIQCSSPPPPAAARKIMRRGDGKGTSGPSTTANSEGPSKAASEIGENGSESGQSKDKTGISREEREARYAEARLRIFGTEPDPEESKNGDSNDVSRSSSAAGKKKNKKRKDDDDFEPRSQFPGYYNQQYGNNGYSDGSFFVPGYVGLMQAPQQYSIPQATSPPPMMFGPGYPPGDGSGSMQYMPPQYGSPQPNMNGQTFAQSPPAQYDLPAQFQAMSFVQGNSGSIPHKMNAPGAYNQGQVQAPSGWPSNYDTQNFVYGQQSFPPQYPDRSMSSPAQNAAAMPYVYGQLPNSMTNAKSQHPLPGSFNRQQFNPQTQAFIPGGGRSGPMSIPSHPAGSPYYSPYGITPPNAMPAAMPPYRLNAGQNPGTPHRSTPPTNNSSGFNSPGGPTHAPSYNGFPIQQMPSQPTSSAGMSNSNHRPTLVQAPSGPMAHPLPQLPNPESSIAKWGTPSHLPPKPPTPADPHPHRFIDAHKHMPQITSIQGLPRSFMSSPPSQHSHPAQ